MAAPPLFNNFNKNHYKNALPLRLLFMNENLHHVVWPPGLPFDIELNSDTLDDNLKNTVNKLGDKAAIIFYDTIISFNELDETVTQLAAYLQQHCSVKKGDRVAIYSQNCPQYVIAFYAIIRAGGVVVPVNPMNLTDELNYVLKDADTATLFCAQDLFPQLQPLLDTDALKHVIAIQYSDYLRSETTLEIPSFIKTIADISSSNIVTPWDYSITHSKTLKPVTINPEDMAILPYTSGSTGKGKGCVHNHISVQHAINSVFQWFDIRPEDISLSVAPMFHVVGMQAGMNVAIRQGCTMVMVPRWDRNVVAECIEKYRISVWPAVPTMVVDLLNHPNIKDLDFSSLRTLFGGGTSMPKAVADQLRAICGVTFLEGYGLTESMAPATANPPHKPQSQCGGIPVFNTDVRILDTETETEAVQGAIGEIIINGPQMLQSYWRNETANEESFFEFEDKTFFRTGDIGRKDPEGYIFIVDRIKRMINASGFKVWPTEVESVLYRHPAIQEVCVIASPDEKRGENVKALVVLKDDAKNISGDSIMDWARDHMAVYKIPRYIEFSKSLPKSGSGKILWKNLQDEELSKS